MILPALGYLCRFMVRRITELLFYGNYYIGLLAVLLAVETAFQLHLPLGPASLYVLLFAVTTGYYTYAYSWLPQQYVSRNPRSRWYSRHQKLVNISLITWLSLSMVSGITLLWQGYPILYHLSFSYWAVFFLMLLAGVFYYGILPRSFFNLRNTGWLKSFTIGFTWACCVTYVPLFMNQWFQEYSPDYKLEIWFFLKNWMFCTVNAIMFDIKDYEDDTNRQLKTFVVRAGLSKTIYWVLLPLVLTGLAAFLMFAWRIDMPLPNFFCNLIPFLLCFAIVLSLNKTKPLLYYLIVIDGVLIVKAICGILGVLLSCKR